MPYCVRLNCSATEAEHALAALLDYPAQGVMEEEPAPGLVSLQIFFERIEAAQDFLRQIEGVPASLEEHVPVQPSAPALPEWEPFCVGERFFLAPPWRDDPTPSGRIRLAMPTGDAYGTGMHAPTQIMLAAMERHLRPGDVVLDLGTGSGILSAAALALGARRLIACDIDPDAARAAGRYLGGSAGLFVGSADSVCAGCVDLVAANIDAPTILALLPEIRRVLRPGGRALLGGFLEERAVSIESSVSAAGFNILDRLVQEEWAGLAASIPELQHGR